jgi:GT2 family glycosyltransferase
MPAADEVRLTVVVPFHDNPGQFELCLAGLGASTLAHELICVDDASRDPRSIEAAKRSANRYLRLERNSGPAAARNEGAKHAAGNVLVFVDSDCVVAPRTLEQIRDALLAEPGAAALFGSYDDAPASPGLITEYRNLLHHWVHHNGPREASTFWAGCGAIRKAAFESVGGFDAAYRRPSIEDIELGMRLKAAGHRILLLPHIQCKHLKRWGLWDMIAVDMTRRAIPWTKLLIERPGVGGDLNLEWKQKLCVVFVFLALLAAPALALVPQTRALFAWLWAPLVLLAPVLWINRALYGLFVRRKGLAFAFGAIPLHLLYFFYGGLAYAWTRATYRPARKSP